MNGAESLVHTLIDGGVDTCFANPGTSEMHFVAALDRIDGIRPVLTLFEGVATGAADGYGRVKGRPAATLLHAGPGLMNGASNLHNARRARSPIVNIVGDHATYHRVLDTPLTSDVEAIARTCSDWVLSSPSASGVAGGAALAIAAAGTGVGSGRVASLILPADTAWGTAVGAEPTRPGAARLPAADSLIEQVADLLKSGKTVGLVLAGDALSAASLETASRIAQATGARLLAANLVACLAKGAGRVEVETIPYAVNPALAFLAPFDALVLVSANEPAAFFAYPDKPGILSPSTCQKLVLTRPTDDAAATLSILADLVSASGRTPKLVDLDLMQPATGLITPDRLGQSIAAFMPQDAIVVDESVTVGGAFGPFMRATRAHWLLKNMGGSIGFGLPAAAGAAVASSDRKVICLEADGSAMYTAQALWTYARENLDILTVIFSNREYAILRNEFNNVGAGAPGPRATEMLDIGRPQINWTELAQSLGVDAAPARDMETFNRLYAHAAEKGRGPFLIEVIV